MVTSDDGRILHGATTPVEMVPDQAETVTMWADNIAHFMKNISKMSCVISVAKINTNSIWV